MNEEEVIKFIRAKQGDKSIRAFAKEIGVSAAYLSDIYLEKRSPGEKCLDYFGISKKKIVVHEYTFE